MGSIIAETNKIWLSFLFRKDPYLKIVQSLIKQSLSSVIVIWLLFENWSEDDEKIEISLERRLVWMQMTLFIAHWRSWFHNTS